MGCKLYHCQQIACGRDATIKCCWQYDQQTLDIYLMLGYCWADVSDGGPALAQHWIGIGVCWQLFNFSLTLSLVSIVGSLRDREVACSASDRQVSNFESCVWRTVSSQSSHHPQEVLLAQFSLYVHKGGLKPDSFHFSRSLDTVPLFVSISANGDFMFTYVHVDQIVNVLFCYEEYPINWWFDCFKHVCTCLYYICIYLWGCYEINLMSMVYCLVTMAYFI